MSANIHDVALTRAETKLLKSIPRSGRPDLDRSDVYSLIHAGFVYAHETDDDSVVYCRTIDGDRYLENRRSDNRRYWLTTLIAVVALVKSFLPEIRGLWAWLWMQLMHR